MKLNDILNEFLNEILNDTLKKKTKWNPKGKPKETLKKPTWRFQVPNCCKYKANGTRFQKAKTNQKLFTHSSPQGPVGFHVGLPVPDPGGFCCIPQCYRWQLRVIALKVLSMHVHILCMYMYMYIYIHIYIYTYIYTHIHTYIHVSMTIFVLFIVILYTYIYIYYACFWSCIFCRGIYFLYIYTHNWLYIIHEY